MSAYNGNLSLILTGARAGAVDHARKANRPTRNTLSPVVYN